LWTCRQALIPNHKSKLTPFGIADGYPAHASVTTFTFRTPLSDEMPAVAYFRPY
jgi:hypothetical protein